MCTCALVCPCVSARVCLKTCTCKQHVWLSKTLSCKHLELSLPLYPPACMCTSRTASRVLCLRACALHEQQLGSCACVHVHFTNSISGPVPACMCTSRTATRVPSLSTTGDKTSPQRIQTGRYVAMTPEPHATPDKHGKSQITVPAASHSVRLLIVGLLA